MQLIVKAFIGLGQFLHLSCLHSSCSSDGLEINWLSETKVEVMIHTLLVLIVLEVLRTLGSLLKCLASALVGHTTESACWFN